MDIILHILVGVFIVKILNRFNLNIFLSIGILIAISTSKELYDHYYILGHVDCMNEHIKDLFFTMAPGAFLKEEV